jgi:Uri superfamily endonuclease
MSTRAISKGLLAEIRIENSTNTNIIAHPDRMNDRLLAQAALYPVQGTYLLLTDCQRRLEVKIGGLGTLHTRQGYYVYIGSAFGPGGLASRLRRHLKNSAGKKHWHLDYLRPVVNICGIWLSCRPERLEHHWAELLLKRPECDIPLARFGASDCKCKSHLFYFAKKSDLIKVRKLFEVDIVTFEHR